MTGFRGRSRSTAMNYSRRHGRAGTASAAAGVGPCPVVELIDPTTAHQPGVSYYRVHKAWPEATDRNRAVRGLQRLFFEILARPSAIEWRAAPGTDEASRFYDAMMSGFRVAHSPATGFPGEPGPEGVHQDSAELTAVVMVHRRNVAAGSAGNRVWSLEQPAGKPRPGDASGRTLLGALTLADRFDTLLVLDREVKHEALPIAPADPTAPAVRDVLTFEVRRPWRAPQQAPAKL